MQPRIACGLLLFQSDEEIYIETLQAGGHGVRSFGPARAFFNAVWSFLALAMKALTRIFEANFERHEVWWLSTSLLPIDGLCRRK